MCCKKLKLFQHQPFTGFLLKLIYSLWAPASPTKNPSLFWFKFRIPCYTYSIAKFQAKSQLQSTIPILYILHKIPSLLLLIVGLVFHITLLLWYFQQKINLTFFFLFVFCFQLQYFQQKSFNINFCFFFQVLGFSYKTFSKNLLTKSQVSCYYKTDIRNFFISKKDKSQIICKNFDTKIVCLYLPIYVNG